MKDRKGLIFVPFIVWSLVALGCTNTGSGPEKSPPTDDSDSAVDADTDTRTDTGTENGGDTDPDPEIGSDAETDSDMDTDTDTDGDGGTDSGTDPPVETDAGTDAGPDAGTPGLPGDAEMASFGRISPLIRLNENHQPFALDVSHLSPSEGLDYVALWYSFTGDSGMMPTPFSPAVEYGSACGGAENRATCLDRLNDALSAVDFSDGISCNSIPDAYSYLWVTIAGDTIEFPADPLAVIGTIDSGVEAILLALSHCYYARPERDAWDGDGESEIRDGAIRSVCDGYEFILRQTVASCAPYQEDRIWIHVSNEGEISEKGRETALFSESRCD